MLVIAALPQSCTGGSHPGAWAPTTGPVHGGRLPRGEAARGGARRAGPRPRQLLSKMDAMRPPWRRPMAASASSVALRRPGVCLLGQLTAAVSSGSRRSAQGPGLSSGHVLAQTSGGAGRGRLAGRQGSHWPGRTRPGQVRGEPGQWTTSPSVPPVVFLRGPQVPACVAPPQGMNGVQSLGCKRKQPPGFKMQA